MSSANEDAGHIIAVAALIVVKLTIIALIVAAAVYGVAALSLLLVGLAWLPFWLAYRLGQWLNRLRPSVKARLLREAIQTETEAALRKHWQAAEYANWQHAYETSDYVKAQRLRAEMEVFSPRS